MDFSVPCEHHPCAWKGWMHNPSICQKPKSTSKSHSHQAWKVWDIHHHPPPQSSQPSLSPHPPTHPQPSATPHPQIPSPLHPCNTHPPEKPWIWSATRRTHHPELPPSPPTNPTQPARNPGSGSIATHRSLPTSYRSTDRILVPTAPNIVWRDPPPATRICPWTTAQAKSRSWTNWRTLSTNSGNDGMLEMAT